MFTFTFFYLFTSPAIVYGSQNAYVSTFNSAL